MGPVLENGSVALVFDRGSGSLRYMRNKLAGETYSIRDDRFCITAEEFQIEQLAAKLVSVELQAESWKAKYRSGSATGRGRLHARRGALVPPRNGSRSASAATAG